MDELVDIWDENGNVTGRILLKSEAHHQGLFHPTVHVWFYTLEGNILLQQRGRHKKTFPLLWDVSVAGHVGAGENIIEAALREVKEEIGLTISKEDLQEIGTFKSIHKHAEDFVDAEFNHAYLCELKESFDALHKQDVEVEALQLFTIDKFKKICLEDNSKDFVPLSDEYYKRIFEELEKRL